MPIIGDSESRALTNRANAQTECLAAPSLKRTGRAETNRNQLAAQLENRCISARAKALGIAAARADKFGANRNLRETLVACSFRDGLRPKLVTYGSPERRHSAGAFKFFHDETRSFAWKRFARRILEPSTVRRIFAWGLHVGAASISLRLLSVSADACACGSWNDVLTRCLIHLRSPPTGLPRRRGESFTHGGPLRSRSNLRRVSTERPSTWLVCWSERTAQSGSALSCRSNSKPIVIMRPRARRRSVLRLSVRMTPEKFRKQTWP